MSDYICPECGYPINGNEPSCPECGVSFIPTPPPAGSIPPPPAPSISTSYYSNPVPLFAYREKTDWANYIYECWIIGWKAWFRTFRFTGRSSRREFFSYFFLTWPCLCVLPIIGFFLGAIGYIALWIRRMHDINKSGWWCLLPFFCFFWLLKKSDPGPNYYGVPEPAKSLID